MKLKEINDLVYRNDPVLIGWFVIIKTITVNKYME